MLDQSGDRPAARSERVCFHAETLQHADEELAERRVVVAVSGDVLPVFESAAGQQNRQIAGAVAAGVSQIAADQNLCLVQLASGSFFCVSQRQQEIFERGHFGALDDSQLFDLGGVAAVMREPVMILGHAFDRRF